MSILAGKSPRLQFINLRSSADIAEALSIDVPTLERFSDEEFKRRFYTPIQLPKKSRGSVGVRIVYEVRLDLRRLHKEILQSLESQFRPSLAAIGFVSGLSILDNAKPHHGAKEVLGLDINDFFGSIRAVQVIRCLRAESVVEEPARVLAGVCTLNDQLPQGACTSPFLSNMVAFDMDEKLLKLAGKRKCRYTRYADDMTFSGEKAPEVDEIENIVSLYGFSLNRRKTRLRKQGRSQFVTGLSVGAPSGVRLSLELRRYLKLSLFNDMKDRASGGASGLDPRVRGLLAHAHSIEPDWVSALIARYASSEVVPIDEVATDR